jgi:predicted ATPase
MGIVKISIENYKCINECGLSLTDLNLLIGENGSGKTNIISAIEYFYNNLTAVLVDNSIFDRTNKFNNSVRITLEFNLRKFVRIARTQLRNDFDIPYMKYYKKILSLNSKADENILKLELTQTKGSMPKWNMDFEDRAIVKSLFPLYYIDVRNINVYDWSDIWNSIGDLTKISDEERAGIIDDYKALRSFKKNKTIHSVNDILKKSNVEILKVPHNEFAKLLSQLYYNGIEFESKGNSLKFYSTGTNSVKYLTLYLNTIKAISKIKLKSPIVIIDEPELNLHHSFIDEISEVIIENSDSYTLLLATHSSRLLKNVITDERDSNIYNLKMRNKYTLIKKMNLFKKDTRVLSTITDEHANAYFSKGMLLVEGESEIELFTNKYIKHLFPKMKHLDIYKSLSDNVTRDIILPSKVNTDVKHLLIIDMDNALEYDKIKRKFKVIKYLKYEHSKEQFAFNSNRIHFRKNTYSARKRIYAMAEKCRLHQDRPLYSCSDNNHKELLSLIKSYLLNYNTFALKTTVEGLLINNESMNSVYDFVKIKKKASVISKLNELYDNYNHRNQLNLLRLFFDGKTDLLLKINKTDLSEDEKKFIDNEKFTKRTWMTEYIEYFILNEMKEIVSECASFEQFKKCTKDFAVYQKIIERFKANFKELCEIIARAEEMVS